MAVADYLNRLATQDVLYLTRYTQTGSGSSVRDVFRGRLRQALNGDWVFNASTGQNGVVGFILGAVTTKPVDPNQGGPVWSSGETPSGGIQVTISITLFPTPEPFTEITTLSTLIPADFTE